MLSPVRKHEIACGVAIAASLLLGGGTHKGNASDAAVQLASLPLLALAASGVNKLLIGRRWIAILLGLTLVIPLFQSIPLPPTLWSALPGRDAVSETYRSVGLELPWLPISVSPWATVRAAFSLLPPVAIFLGVLECGRDERRRLLLVVVFFGLASVLLDIVQIVQGPESELRFYRVTDPTAGVGLFANRNHNAAFLYSVAPLAAYAFLQSTVPRSVYGIAAVFGSFMMVVLGLMMTGSRAALVLGAASIITTCLLISNGRFATPSKIRAPAYVAAGGILFVTTFLAPSFGLTYILDRFRDQEIASDARWIVFHASLEATKAFFPFGTGLGTFERVYPLFETTNTIIPAIVNHVHNDPLEVVLECGLPGLLVIMGWLASMVICALRNTHERDTAAKRERFAALIVVGLLFVHSLADYPLRTSAIAVVFAMCCAIICTDADSIERRKGERPKRSAFVHAG